MEKLNANAVALSLGITTVILSFICFILIAILPMQIVVSGANTLFHGINFSSIAAKNISFVGLITGVIIWFLVATAIGYIFAIVYNWIGEKF